MARRNRFLNAVSRISLAVLTPAGNYGESALKLLAEKGAQTVVIAL